MAMDIIEQHASQLPAIDDRWEPRPYDRAELREALLEAAIAGPQVSHPLDNVLRHIRQLYDGDPDKQFGMTRLAGALSPRKILDLVGEEAGFEPDHTATHGPVPVDPDHVLDRCEAVGDRLAAACRRGETVILATGHPVGLAHLYTEVGRELARRGAKPIRPAEGEKWRDAGHHHWWQIRYLGWLAVLTDKASARHTHSGGPMRRMLAEAVPHVVFADHGFAGAAIEHGVDTVSIADVNDPALIVSKGQGRTDVVIVMDDNVQPDTYWPCFQAIVSRLPSR
jgi:histidinol phosphate phosphatase hisN-like protein